jgi:hypothetical protein
MIWEYERHMRPLIVFAFIALVFTGGVLYFVKDGVQPSPIRVLNPTNFTGPEKLGVELAKRFYNELKTKRLIVLGGSESLQTVGPLWQAFIGKVKDLQIEFSLIQYSLSDKQLDELKTRVQSGERIILLSPSELDLKDKLLETEAQTFVIFTAPFLLSLDSKVRSTKECDSEDHRKSLNCIAIKASNQYFRKKLKLDLFGAFMEKYDKNFGVLYIWEPR